MVQPGEEPQVKGQFVMKGNSEEHPDAHLIFRIFVDSIAEEIKSKKHPQTKNNKKGANMTNPYEKQKSPQQDDE